MKYMLNPEALRRIKFEHRLDTDREIADRIGVDATTLYRAKHQRRAPSLEMTMKLVSVFGLDLKDVLVRVDPDEVEAAA